jgi:hypothetical protein
MRWILLCWLAAALGDQAPVRTIELKGKTHHVQGIDLDATRLWVTSVDKDEKKGYLQEFALPSGELRRTVEVDAGERFHPGGMARDGESL